MIIRKLKLNNIRSYENAEIVFPEGSTVLLGDIGSGKTSILLAIEFALFGLQPGQKGASLLRSGKEEGLVALEFEVDGKEIMIERELKRGKSVNQSGASLSIDGTKKDLSVTELKNFVLSVLSYPHEFAKKTNLLYKFTVYTPQEEMKQIILESTETRLDTLRHIFGIDKYKKIKENTSIVAAKLREQIREYTGMVKDLDVLKKTIESEKQNILDLEKKLEEDKKILKSKKESRENIEKNIIEIKDKIEEKRNYEKEIEKSRIMLLGKKEQISSFLKDKKDLERQIEEAKSLLFDEKKFNELQEKKQSQEKEKQLKNKEYMELMGKINSLKSKIIESEKLKDQIGSLKMCPTCFQSVDQSYKQNILVKFEEAVTMSNKRINEHEGEKQKLTNALNNFDKEILEITKTLDHLKIIKIKLEALSEKKNKISSIDKQLDYLDKDIKLLEKQIENLSSLTHEFKKYDITYERKSQELQNALKEERICDISIAQTEKEIELTKRRIEDTNQAIIKKEAIQSQLITLSEMEDWLSSDFSQLVNFTERNVMLKLREEFSKLFNEWFNILVPDVFTTRLDEDFTPIIEQQEYSLDYSFLSGGERTAIALAYRLALNQVINSLLSKIKTRDLVILDEPTDGFSEQQLDKMRDVLSQLAAKQLIIVSHEQKIESFVENIIKFKKENGITKIE